MQILSQRRRDDDEVKPLVSVRPGRVLLAEDDPELRSLIAMVLRRRAFQVEVARDGSEALERLASAVLGRPPGRGPDLLITDHRMPKFDGLDVIEALRLVGVRTPIILITAFGDAATHARAEALGVSAVLDKPFDLNDLLSLAERATSGYWL